MDFDKLFTNVMNLDPAIRYAVIQNNLGEKIEGGLEITSSPS